MEYSGDSYTESGDTGGSSRSMSRSFWSSADLLQTVSGSRKYRNSSKNLRRSFRSLKISFYILFSVNIALVITYAVTLTYFYSHINYDGNALGRVWTSQQSACPTLQRVQFCVKCVLLLDVISSRSPLLSILAEEDCPDICCFRAFKHMLDFLGEMMKQSMDDFKYGNQRFKGHYSGNENLSLAHLIATRQFGNPADKQHRVQYSTRDLQTFIKGGIRLENKTMVMVSHTGYYYIYSRIYLIAPLSHFEHKIIRIISFINYTLLSEQVRNSTEQSLFLSSIIHLKEGDKIVVEISDHNAISKKPDQTYFGIYAIRIK